MLNESIRLLLSSCKYTAGNIQTMKLVNEKLKEEGERLDVVKEDLYSTKGVLKASSKLITSILKDYYKDKFIVGLAVLILLMVIAVVVVGIVKKK